jgi:hypothetical protein
MARRSRPLVLLAAAGVALSGAAPAAAADTRPVVTELSDSVLEAPAGAACEFPVTLTSTGGRVTTFPPGDGPDDPTVFVTRTPAMTFTSTDEPSRTYATRPAALKARWTPNGDGSVRVEFTGQHVMAFLPDDRPAGPALTVFTGRQVFVFEADETWTLVSQVGRTVDVCAQLAP